MIAESFKIKIPSLYDGSTQQVELRQKHSPLLRAVCLSSPGKVMIIATVEEKLLKLAV